MRSRKRALSELEHLVMKFLWSYGRSTAEQVREGLSKTHVMKDPTVRTILRRLEGKGYASHSMEGRKYVYEGIEKPESIAVRAVRNVLDRFCNGSIEQLLVGMVEGEVIESSELQRLAQKIAEGKANK